MRPGSYLCLPEVCLPGFCRSSTWALRGSSGFLQAFGFRLGAAGVLPEFYPVSAGVPPGSDPGSTRDSAGVLPAVLPVFYGVGLTWFYPGATRVLPGFYQIPPGSSGVLPGTGDQPGCSRVRNRVCNQASTGVRTAAAGLLPGFRPNSTRVLQFYRGFYWCCT